MAFFNAFSDAVNRNWSTMSIHELFVVDVDTDLLWETYLKAFPPGTNPLFRERTEHDCSCCRDFIKNLGPVVCLAPGGPRTVWSFIGTMGHQVGFYATVAQQLEELVLSAPIKSIFRTKEAKYGAHHNFEGDHKWHHFWGDVARRHMTSVPEQAKGEHAASVQVLSRGLNEISPTALITILDLIDSNNLYRGEEYRRAVEGFIELQREYLTLPLSSMRDDFVWRAASAPSVRFRNTVIGTLAVDLSEGVDLEAAVKAFETKVAPTNYKRPTALITPAMVKSAMGLIDELGLEPALDRRHARLSDVSVTDVLWVSGSAKGAMRGGVSDLLMEAAKPKAKVPSSATEITMEDLLSVVLPKTKKLEVFVSNDHLGNFVSITAPATAGAPGLFKWDNGFGWSYDGNLTDSIKERVKKAGGSVEGDLCCRLAWDYSDDLDFHMREPDGGHIYFGNRRKLSRNGGMLDVDANGADGVREHPVENIFYKSSKSMTDGKYHLSVHNYFRRSSGVGFEVEIETPVETINISHSSVMKQGSQIDVATITVENGLIVGVKPQKGLNLGRRVQEKWGLSTESFVEVDTLMLSPNYWGGNQVGNKHWFFIINGCRNPLPTRGIYNEFLRGDLEQHRKVFEVLGDKTKCPVEQEQLSGLGFSSTRKDAVSVRCDGRVFNVQF